MVGLKLYVEGGGDAQSQKTECRKGFRSFLEKAGLKGRMPSIVACGSRRNAFESFKTAINSGQPAMLLVDSEGPVATASPWQHLGERDGDKWVKPDTAGDDHCHLMVQCMETWFLADRATLQKYFGQGFKETSLPSPDRTIETVGKTELYAALADATKSAQPKGRYNKGRHSFAILERLDPEKVTQASPWAARLVTALGNQRK